MAIGAPVDELLTPSQVAGVFGALDALIDEWFSDVADLLNGAAVADLSMVAYLPRPYMSRYTPLFAEQFLTCFLTVAWKLHAPGDYRLACVAEEIALAAVIERAGREAASEEDADAIDGIGDALFADTDLALLFDPKYDGIEETAASERLAIAHLRFADWFTPFRPEDPVHPYVDPGVETSED
jgi:hypothetical protein